MKNTVAVLILIVACSVSWAIFEEPIKIKESVILVKDKITIDENTGSTKTENKLVKYVDEQTVDIVTTVTTTAAVQSQTFDRAVLQTELDHMIDRIAAAQKQMDEALERKAELILILGVFE